MRINTQQKFDIFQTAFEGVMMLRPFVTSDTRGIFIKDYDSKAFRENGFVFSPREMVTIESKRGVLRGLHFQMPNGQ